MKYDWKDLENNTSYFYKLDNGLIVAQVHNIVHTKIWLAKAFLHGMPEEKYLGQYITADHAKKAVEKYYDVQERTFVTYDE